MIPIILTAAVLLGAARFLYREWRYTRELDRLYWEAIEARARRHRCHPVREVKRHESR